MTQGIARKITGGSEKGVPACSTLRIFHANPTTMAAIFVPKKQKEGREKQKNVAYTACSMELG